MRTKSMRVLGCAMLAALAIAALGPSLCRAAMSAERAAAADCCDGKEKAPPTEKRGGACPLHGLGSIHLLPASARAGMASTSFAMLSPCSPPSCSIDPSNLSAPMPPGGCGSFYSGQTPLFVRINCLRL